MTLSTAQTATGLKLFSTLPQSSVVPTIGAQLVNKTYVDSLVPTPVNAVTIDGSQTLLTGIKTFTNLPECSAVPTSGSQLVNKTYVDGLTPATPTITQVLTAGNNALDVSQIFSATGSPTTTNIDDAEVQIIDGTSGINSKLEYDNLTITGNYAPYNTTNVVSNTGMVVNTADNSNPYQYSTTANYATINQVKQNTSTFFSESATMSAIDGLYHETNDTSGSGDITKLSMKSSVFDGTIRCFNSGTPSALAPIDFQASALTLNGNPFPAIPNIDQVLNAGSLATNRTQVFNVSTGFSTNSISATSVGLYAPNGYANDYNGNYTAGGFGLQENTRGTLVSLSAQEPSLQLVTTPAVAGYSATALYTAGGINTNYTFGINTGQLNIGSSVYINNGVLDLANNNITSVNNIQLNTINGSSPTTIGLTWADFAGSSAYNYLPSNAYQLINGGTSSSQYVNSFQVDNNGLYVTTLDSQVLSIKDNNNFYAHYKINGLDTTDTAYEIQCSGGTQPLNIIASTINLNGNPLTPVVRGTFNYSGVGINSGTQSIFYSSPATLPAGTFAVTWSFQFDGNFVNNASPTFFSVKAYANLYSTTYGVVSNSGLYPSAIMSYDNGYHTTISYTDYYTITASDTYYPYVYQENPIGLGGNVYLTGVFIQV
jgi:hypothetical protein